MRNTTTDLVIFWKRERKIIIFELNRIALGVNIIRQYVNTILLILVLITMLKILITELFSATGINQRELCMKR